MENKDKFLMHLTAEELKKIVQEAVQNEIGKTSLTIPDASRLTIYRRKEVAELFHVTVQTINAWVKSGQLPKPTKVGRIPVFSHDQIKHLLKESVSNPSSTF